ncbi:MAG TPA: Rieske 2Fe-2S domain-containing protein [Pirellulaceae bacterium]|nr:Rieske 2Fe-2S domain-containing protein [Pirellulaceae bacterium]
MSNFVRVAKTSDLADSGRTLLEVDDRIVALFRVGGEYFCIDDVCTHDGGPLSDGKLENHSIACPRHGAKFDIRTGKALTMPATVDTAAHEVKVEGENILVRLCQPGELAGQRAAAPAAPASRPPGERGDETATARAPSPDALVAVVIEQALNPAAEEGKTDEPSAQPPAARELSEDLVREELKKVVDPELFVNIVDLGLIYNVDLLPAADGKTNCKIEMTMTSPMCPAGPQLIANSKQVLGALPGMGNVEVKIVLDPPWTPDKMTDEARDQLGIF